MNDASVVKDATLAEKTNPKTVKLLTQNTAVLANVVELTTSVILEMADKDLKGSLSTAPSREVIGNLVGNVIREELKIK